jgi:16S rRNA (guanine527-N7)-methyltransferase
MCPAKSSPESILEKGLRELSLTFSVEQVRAFKIFLIELKKWNKAYNLTSLKTDEDIVIKHFMDSLLYLEAIPEGEVSVMDVGSGAGFPGIPIKIMRPEIKMHLLEPSRKKASFLRHIIRTLRLDGIEVTEKRIEDVGSLVDVAVTRALFDVREFIKKASPYVREGGRLVLSKGPRVNEELKAIKGTRYELLALTLPVAKIKRFIVVITKCSQKRETAERLHSATLNNTQTNSTDTCINAECRLRKAGCKGFEGCPGFKART